MFVTYTTGLRFIDSAGRYSLLLPLHARTDDWIQMEGEQALVQSLHRCMMHITFVTHFHITFEEMLICTYGRWTVHVYCVDW